MDEYDAIIVGQGLAGTALAWRLIEQGQRVLIVDRGDTATPSRVAAGLLTPITGRRLAISERWRDYWPVAQAFYRQIEALTGTRFFETQPAIRVLASRAERDVYESRRLDAEFAALTEDTANGLPTDQFHAADGSFAMLAGGRLNTTAYLDASRQWFTEHAQFRVAEVDAVRDLKVSEQQIAVASLDARARQIVFCRGLGDRDLLRDVARFEPAKGEMLTVRIPGLSETRVVHRGCWLARCSEGIVGEGIYRVGATFNREELDDQPSQAGRAELEEKLRELLKLPYEVIDHTAATRPILAGRQPIARSLPTQPRIAAFNGLGAKGALWAPLLADQFAGKLVATR